MQIADLRIENFRGVRSGRIRFGQHSVLVGPNNCGKTTIIEALALLFGRDRMVRTLTEHDFFGSDPTPTDRIRLVATIIGFEGENPADFPEWFRDDRGVPKWWNAAANALAPTRTDASCRLACQIGFCAHFNRAELEVETVRYFHDDDSVGDPFVDEAVTAVPNRLIRDIGFFLVPASRTWDRVVSFGSELFRRVVASADGTPSESVLGERNRLRAPLQALEADPHLLPIVNALNAELGGFFRAGPTLQLRVTATDSDGLLDAVVPHYARGAALGLPARRHGSGLISLQHLLLLLSAASVPRPGKASGWRLRNRNCTCPRRCSDGSSIEFRPCLPKPSCLPIRRWSLLWPIPTRSRCCVTMPAHSARCHCFRRHCRRQHRTAYENCSN